MSGCMICINRIMHHIRNVRIVDYAQQHFERTDSFSDKSVLLTLHAPSTIHVGPAVLSQSAGPQSAARPQPIFNVSSQKHARYRGCKRYISRNFTDMGVGAEQCSRRVHINVREIQKGGCARYRSHHTFNIGQYAAGEQERSCIWWLNK